MTITTEIFVPMLKFWKRIFLRKKWSKPFINLQMVFFYELKVLYQNNLVHGTVQKKTDPCYCTNTVRSMVLTRVLILIFLCFSLKFILKQGKTRKNSFKKLKMNKYEKRKKAQRKQKLTHTKKHKEKHTNNGVKGREIDVEARETE